MFTCTPRVTIHYWMSGVTFVLVRKGMDERTLEQGLEKWRKRHPIEVVEDPEGDDVRNVP